jgi:hypothetical protein
MDLPKEYLLNSFHENFVIPICEFIDIALTSRDHLFFFEGYTEIGADQCVSLVMGLFIYANPPSFCSVAEYLQKCFLSLGLDGLCHQSIQFHVITFMSAYEHFVQALQTICLQTNQ